MYKYFVDEVHFENFFYLYFEFNSRPGDNVSLDLGIYLCSIPEFYEEINSKLSLNDRSSNPLMWIENFETKELCILRDVFLDMINSKDIVVDEVMLDLPDQYFKLVSQAFLIVQKYKTI